MIHEDANASVPATLAEYDALPKAERTYFRRAAYGAYGELTPALENLRQLLDERNEREGWFAEKWTSQLGDDEE